MKEEDYLLLSGIQHYAFCPRQWALIHIENQWADNWRTISGTIMHERTHDSSIKEKRGDVITFRALKVVSHKLGLSGECDVVEFRKDKNGIELNGYSGKYLPFPIEYKRGKAKSFEADKLQLCAQAMALEEMLLCDINCGALFYGETHRRHDVDFTIDIRQQVEETSKNMHKYTKSHFTPKPISGKHCSQCSLYDECLPMMQKSKTVKEYISEHFD